MFLLSVCPPRKCHCVIWLWIWRSSSSCNWDTILSPPSCPATHHLQTGSISTRKGHQAHGHSLYVLHLCRPAGELRLLVECYAKLTADEQQQKQLNTSAEQWCSRLKSGETELRSLQILAASVNDRIKLQFKNAWFIQNCIFSHHCFPNRAVLI